MSRKKKMKKGVKKTSFPSVQTWHVSNSDPFFFYSVCNFHRVHRQWPFFVVDATAKGQGVGVKKKKKKKKKKRLDIIIAKNNKNNYEEPGTHSCTT
jgi:hypothetical protein